MVTQLAEVNRRLEEKVIKKLMESVTSLRISCMLAEEIKTENKNHVVLNEVIIEKVNKLMDMVVKTDKAQIKGQKLMNIKGSSSILTRFVNKEIELSKEKLHEITCDMYVNLSKCYKQEKSIKSGEN